LSVQLLLFQDFQPTVCDRVSWCWWSTNVTDGRMDGQTDRRTTCNCKTVLCTIVYRTVKQTKYWYHRYYRYCRYCIIIDIIDWPSTGWQYPPPRGTTTLKMFSKMNIVCTQCEYKIWRTVCSHSRAK